MSGSSSIIYPVDKTLGFIDGCDFSNIFIDSDENYPLYADGISKRHYQYPIGNDYTLVDDTGLIREFGDELYAYSERIPSIIMGDYKIPITKLGNFEYSGYYWVSIHGLNSIMKPDGSLLGVNDAHDLTYTISLFDTQGIEHKYMFFHLAEYLNKTIEPMINNMVDKF